MSGAAGATPRRRQLATFSVLLSVCAAAAPAQTVGGTAQALIDSASSARASYALAARATTTGETLIALVRAAHSWPTQPAYWSATARFAARASDTATVIEAVTALGRLQTGWSVAADTAVQRLAGSPRLARALQQLTQQSAPVVGGRVAVTIADSLLFAEGLDADPRTDALYVASIRHRTILEVSADGRQRDLHLSRHAGIGAILGVRVAPDGRTLYATMAGHPAMTGYTAADSNMAAVLRIRISDGAIEQRWDLPDDGARHWPGDLAIGEDGTVYVTDSYAPVLFRVRASAPALEAIRHPLFRSLQGVAPVSGSDVIIVADYSHGLLRVDLTDLSVTRIADVAGTTSLGFDGIVWQHHAIVGVQNGVSPARIARLTLSADHRRVERFDILDRQPALADEPTIGTLWRGGFVYVANSQWEKYDDNGRRRPGTTLQSTRLICVPLSSAHPERQAAFSTARNGTRSTTSAPPSSPVCSVNEASPE